MESVLLLILEMIQQVLVVYQQSLSLYVGKVMQIP
jgi:hypothetical protein